MLPHQLALGDVRIAREDEGVYSDLAVGIQFGYNLIRVTDYGRTGATTGTPDPGPQPCLHEPVGIRHLA